MAKIITLIPSEAAEQRALVKWMKLQPEIRDYVVKLNNEGKRTEIQGRQLNLMGMCRGASDLFLAYPKNGLGGLWLEVKRKMVYPPSARRSDTWMAQEGFLHRMRGVGYGAVMVYGWEDGKRVVENYLKGDKL